MMGWRSALSFAALLLAGCTATSPPTAQAPPGAVEPAPPGLILTPLAPSPQTTSEGGGEDGRDVKADDEPARRPPGLYSLELDVGGEHALGLVAVPHGVPRTLVLVAHGWGGDAALHQVDLEALAAQGALAAAMDYRGPQGAYKVQTGVEDTNAATVALQREFPEVDRTMLYGWSMGGEIALLAPITAPPGTYDYVFSGAGVMDLETFWHEWPLARPAIENETGGPPAEQATAYRDRSPQALAVAIAAQGLARVFLVHAAADWPVPVEHAERMYAALEEAGQPVSYYVVTKDRAALCVAGQCHSQPVPAGHEAGRFAILSPFIEHRIDRLPDPAHAALRGTYDAESGKYDPDDVG